MRRFSLLLAVAAFARVASAQMPPSISKPIEQARKAAEATNAQTAVINNQQSAKPAAAAPQAKGTPASATTKAPAKGAAAASSRDANVAPQAAGKSTGQDTSKVTFYREVFAYVSAGRRDPFASPIETGEIRPLVADLRLTGIIYDATGRNSVAILRDMSTQQQYRAKVGQMLGRARVTQIKPQEIALSIEEYGFSRQETLTLNVKQTQPNKGKP
jgi:hypothetical protein